MIDIKNPEEIKIMQESGKILSEVLWEVIDSIEPGVTEKDLDTLADKLIYEKGGEPNFKREQDYKNATCISTNEVIVHGIPTDYKLKEGDVIGVDCGVLYKGFNSDMAQTVRVKSSTVAKAKVDKQKSKVKSSKEDEIDKFLDVGEKALDAAIKVAVTGNRIGHISRAIQKIVEEDNDYSVVRALIGHGVGRELHEEPDVPGYLNKKIENTPRLIPGMTIAIEVIYNMGRYDVMLKEDGWTIASRDGSLSGLFERSIAITENKPIILTP